MAKSKCKLPEWGEEGVRRFFSRYEMCCDLNKWDTDKDKVGQLYPLLSDKVFDFVCGLSEDDRSKYETVKQKLLAEYEDTELEVTYADRFSSRKLKKGEDLSSLMLDLKKLVVKGYPTFSNADQAQLVNNQFMKSLSPGAKKHVLLNPPKLEAGAVLTMASCDLVLAQARLIDQIEKSSNSTEGATGGSSAQLAAVAEPKVDQMGQMITAMEELTRVVQGLSSPSVAGIQQENPSNRQRPISGRSGFRGQCYSCGESGHLARNCPSHRSRRNRTSVCNTCGNPGHISKDCALVKKQQSPVCRICGNPGHSDDWCAMKGRLPPSLN